MFLSDELTIVIKFKKTPRKRVDRRNWVGYYVFIWFNNLFITLLMIIDRK